MSAGSNVFAVPFQLWFPPLVATLTLHLACSSGLATS